VDSSNATGAGCAESVAPKVTATVTSTNPHRKPPRGVTFG
jgi:hypothetical protein